jgi:hypothetical protein
MVSLYMITLARMLSANDAGLSTRWNVGADEAITRHRTKSSSNPDSRSTKCRNRRGLNCNSLLPPSTTQMELVRPLSLHVLEIILYVYTIYQDDHAPLCFFPSSVSCYIVQAINMIKQLISAVIQCNELLWLRCPKSNSSNTFTLLDFNIWFT